MNKFFKIMREGANKDPLYVENLIKGIGLSTEEENLFMQKMSHKENFLFNRLFFFSQSNKDLYRVAKNSYGDYLVEMPSGTVVAIESQNGTGKFKLYKNNKVGTNLLFLMEILDAFITVTISECYGAADDDLIKEILSDFVSPEYLSKFNENYRRKYYAIFSEINDLIFNQLFSLPNECFLNSRGDVFDLDLDTKLPSVSNMVATYSMKFEVDRIPKGKIYIPKADDFENIFCADSESKVTKIFDKIENYNLTPDREFSIDESEILAENEETNKKYVLTPETSQYLDDYYDLCKAGMNPQSAAFYGPSGAGKSVAVKVVARELHRPYVSFKMRENSDEDSLRGSIKKVSGHDGEIEYEDTPIVKALKSGWVCEIQELSCCSNQGAETFFNPILDGTKTFEDATGRTFNVHPDALIIFTYNPSYCENNQVATSLLNRIDDCYRFEFPDRETAIDIFKKNTRCSDDYTLGKIYDICFNEANADSIVNYINNEELEEELSIRQVCSWIKRYMNCRRYNNQENGWLEAAEHTIIQSLGQREPDVQQSIRQRLETVFG